MSSFRLDLRHAVQGLVQRPGFALAALLTFAVGIGGTVAIFSVVHHVLLRPLPYERPEELAVLDVRSPQGYLISLSIPNYRDWRERNRVFRSFGAAAGWGFALTGRGPAEIVSAQIVLGEFFETLGVEAGLGRLIPAAETGPGAEPVAVLGHAFWRDRLAGDPGILGRTLLLDGASYTVVGVLPPGFGYPSPETQVYTPMGVLAAELPWDDRDSSFGTEAIARLAPGVSLAEARRDMERVGREVEELAGEEVAQPEVHLLPDRLLGDVETQLWVLLGATAFVLLIGVANVMNLLLTQGERRRREVAVRTALGARRGDLVRRLLVESLLLGLAGGAVGVGGAFVALEALVPALPAQIPPALLERIGVDGTVLAFSLGLSLVAGLLAGVAPALKVSRRAVAGVLREASAQGGGGRSRLRSGLVVAEVALALVLLVGAGLMVESLSRLRHADKSFDAEGLLTTRVYLPDARGADKASWLASYQEILERCRELPGVERAAATLLLPLTGRSWELRIQPEGVPFDPDEGDSVLYGVVSEDYFDTLGVPILRGRAFTSADREGNVPVAVIDETMAERYWPGQDPIGKRVAFETEGGDGGDEVPVYRTVVGVAGNVRHYELASPSRIQVYVPLAQTLERWGMALYVVLETAGPPSSLVGPLRTAVAAFDPEAPLARIRTLEDYVAAELAPSRAVSGVLAAFGAVALLLAAVGVFGVMSFTVAQRTREIGIRMALGAEGTRVVSWLIGRGLTLVLAGIGLGALAAAGLSRLLASLVYEVSPLDPGTYAAVAATLLAVSALAAALPASRAARVDPVRVLNAEG